MSARLLLGIALPLLALLYLGWFWHDKHFVATMLVFPLPALLLALGVWGGSTRAAFWSGVFGLFWFSHGVMTAYSYPELALWGWMEIVLSLVIVLAASWPGLRARFGKRRG